MTKLTDVGNWWWNHNVPQGIRHQYSGWIYNCQDFDAHVYLEQGHGDCICDLVGYYFYNPNIQIDDDNMFYQAVSSRQMTDYIDQVSRVYSDRVDETTGIASFLYDDCDLIYNIDYRWDETYDLSSYEFNRNYRWWLGLFGEKKGWNLSESIDKICVIEDPAAVANQYAQDLTGLSDEYKIGKADAAYFKDYLQHADGVVVLLRFDVTTYEMHELDVLTYNGGEGNVYNRQDYGEGKTWMAQQWFYKDVDVTRVEFSKDSVIYTYHVKAVPVDLIPGIDVKETPHTVYASLWSNLNSMVPDFSQVMKYLRIALLVLFAIVLLVIIGKFAGLFRFLRLQRMMRKQRKQEKTKRKRD